MHPGVTLAVTGMDGAQVPLGSPALQSPKLQLVCQKDEQEGTNISPMAQETFQAAQPLWQVSSTSSEWQIRPPALEIQIHSPVVSAH